MEQLLTPQEQAQRIRELFNQGILINKNTLQQPSAVVIPLPEPIAAFSSPASASNGHSVTLPYEITLSHHNLPKKYAVSDFTRLFVSRYKFFESLLRNRKELTSLSSVSRLLSKREREAGALIGLVSDISQTKTGNYVLTVEDVTGEIPVIISKNKKELLEQVQEIIPDEVIGIVGKTNDKAFFADQIIWPDIPHREIKTQSADVFVVFLSDVHVGSRNFLEEEFHRFLSWINGESGNEEQRAIAKKVQYIFITGDVVDGVGIYPSQEKELLITDIKKQYDELVRLLRKIPPHITITICPGNHDAVHLAEPQPVFDRKFSSALYDLPNVQLVSNPAVVTIGKQADFSGFTILMYHGYSFDYYVANCNPLRLKGGYKRGDLIMKFLLKRRHLAPAFTSTPYLPSAGEDPLIIRTVPDFFVTGHIHYAIAGHYRGTTLISSSCWQSMTSFQEKLGHEPEPARVPVVNLRTREVKMLKFI